MNANTQPSVLQTMTKYTIIVLFALGCTASEFDVSDMTRMDPPEHMGLDAKPKEAGPDVVGEDAAMVAREDTESGSSIDTSGETYTSTTDTDPVDSSPKVDTAPVVDSAPIGPFKSTPGYVACTGPSDVCRKSDNERCCIVSGVATCRGTSDIVCSYTETYWCDEPSDCASKQCCVGPSGGSSCDCEPSWVHLCQSHSDCPSGSCVTFGAWPGHGKCAP